MLSIGSSSIGGAHRMHHSTIIVQATEMISHRIKRFSISLYRCVRHCWGRRKCPGAPRDRSRNQELAYWLDVPPTSLFDLKVVFL